MCPVGLGLKDIYLRMQFFSFGGTVVGIFGYVFSKRQTQLHLYYPQNFIMYYINITDYIGEIQSVQWPYKNTNS